MSKNQAITELTQKEYQYGFSNDFAADEAPRGLSEDIVRLISAKKNEPAWLLEWRLKAYRQWLTMTEPTWPNVKYPKIDYQDIIYYSAPKPKSPAPGSLNEVDPEMRAMFDKLGISLREQERLSGIAVEAVVDSVSVATTSPFGVRESAFAPPAPSYHDDTVPSGPISSPCVPTSTPRWVLVCGCA